MLPFEYEGAVFRPPSEAGSLILQATVGCSHNRCSFCAMYKQKRFHEREPEKLSREISAAAALLPSTRRVFLADGNAMALPTIKLLGILEVLKGAFPLLERVAVYSNPQDLLQKDVDELIELRRHKLGMIYLGVESGSALVLRDVHKGATPDEIIRGAMRVKTAEIPLSVTVINGLAGLEGSREHARETARLLNEIDPAYLGLLSLMVVPGTIMHRRMRDGVLTSLGPWDLLREIRWMVKELSLSNCVFRSNHASNYLPLKAILSRDQEKLLNALDLVLQNKSPSMLRKEYQRGL